MGQVIEKVIVQNLEDIFLFKRGECEKGSIRTIKMEAIVDTGASLLCLLPSAIRQLGLHDSKSRCVRTANSVVERRIFKGANIIIRDRDMSMSVMESDETTPALIGCLVLEALDFVVDPVAKKLLPNPDHNGEWMTDVFLSQTR